MRMLWPNLDREDGLETVLEVPIPEEMFPSNSNKNRSSWQNMISWVKPYHNDHDKSSPPLPTSIFGASRNNAEIQLLLGVVGAPLIPLPISSGHLLNRNIKEHAIEASMAKYIVKQYIAATGGEKALNSIDSMYAMGKVKMVASEFVNAAGEGLGLSNSKATKIKSSRVVRNGGGEAGGGGGGGEVVGGFVLWQKRPELWCLELVVSGCKISAGSDGKVAWRQTPWHHSHASRGPPRPLRRALQGLDPRSAANLFSNSICIGEKNINNEDCFVLKLEAESSTLKARSSSNVEIIQHTVWGYFSQRTGLLVQLEDSHLLRIKSPGSDDTVFWETTMVSNIQDYKTVDGINIAHAGRTAVSLVRYSDHHHRHHQTSSGNHSSCTRMEEIWAIEEVDFNIKGLSMDCFLPPGDLIITKKEEQGCGVVASNVVASNARLPFKIRAAGPPRVIGVSKVVAIDVIGPEDI